MQNRYVGDVGDFGKYGLLRASCHPSGSNKLKLGVVWYLVPDESHNEDGKYISYLEPTVENERRFRQCDPPLYDSFSEIVITRERQVSHIQDSSVLPPGTRYHDDYLSFNDMPSNGSTSRAKRLAYREGWVKGALEATKGCDVVFVDPDNGLEVKTERHQKLGPKYAYFDELTPYVQRGQSLIIYHHIGRNGTAEEQIQGRLIQLRNYFGVGEGVFALLYHRGTLRVFFVISQNIHAKILSARAKELLSRSWSQHFTIFHPK